MAVDYITFTQLVDLMITILTTDTDIETFCQTNYSKSLFVADQLDASDKLGESDAPFVEIFRNKGTSGESVANWTYELELESGIVDDTQDTSTPNVILQNGPRKVEELKNLIYVALRDNLNCNATIDTAEDEIDETQHPMYVNYQELTISIPQVIGSVIGLP